VQILHLFPILFIERFADLCIHRRTENPRFQKSEFFRSLFLSAASGIGSLFAVNIASAVTGVSLAVNLFTLLVSGIGGVPGTVFLLLCDVILNKV
jgi:hypothetical protein